nr:complement factor H-related protein 4-like [Cherax quadricarinatus]
MWDYEAWKVGESLAANCTDQHLTKDGFTNTSFSCTSNGWLTDFPCLTVCEGEPVVNNATTTWKSGMWLEGKKVTAKCKPHNHFSPKVYSATINCTNQGWENTTGCVYCKLIFVFLHIYEYSVRLVNEIKIYESHSILK